MNQVSPRDAVLQIGSQLKNALRSLNTSNSATPNITAPADANETQVEKTKTELHLGANKTSVSAPKTNIEVNELKREIGEQRAYLSQVIKNKLSEYGLPPSTQLSIERTSAGIVVNGPVVHSQLEKISFDLNQDQHFTQAYNAVNKQNPTLEYASNVSKLTQAYGKENQVFESLVSEKKEFNQLKDLTLRYQSLQSQMQSSQTTEI